MFPVNDKPPLPSTPVSVHLANWQSAEKDPETTQRLVQEELDQGWAYRFDGTLGEAKEKWRWAVWGWPFLTVVHRDWL